MAKRKKRPVPGGDGILYVAGLAVLLCGWLMVMAVRWANAPEVRMTDLMLPLALGITFLVVWLLIRVVDFQGDRMVPPLTLLLAGLGFLVQFRLGNLAFGDAAGMSMYAYPLGVLAFLSGWLLFRRGRYGVLASLSLPCLLLSGAVLGAILVFGQKFRGAVYLPGQVNPSEVVKVLLAVFLAGVITDFLKPLQQTVAGLPAPPVRSLVTLGVLWAIPMVLLVAQRDLGMIVLLNLVLLILLFMATGKWGYLVVGLGFSALAMVAGYHVFSHARIRYMVWLDPFTDPTGRGWQILQSLSAMFTGGMWGSGLGAGAPAVVPIAASDFVYAALAEELGFAGCVALIVLFVVLFFRGYRIADHVRSPFGQTLAAALTTMLAVQTLMNLGGVTKAIPLTGITLPLISHGGSSLVTTLFMLGLLVALSEPVRPRKR